MSSSENPASPPAAAAPRATLDPVALARLRELDPDGRNGVVTRVLGAFESSLARMLAQVAALPASAPAAPGSPGLAEIAHTLKSSAASVGALELSALCDAIEKRERGGRGDAASERLHDIARLLTEGEAALAAVRAMLRP